MNILDQINQDKQNEVDQTLQHITPDRLQKSADDQRMPKDFREALKADGLSIIAEIKKASPSKGLIRPDFDPISIARSYNANGANCISVLTESKYFQGSADYLKQVIEVVEIPVLRKDFIVDPRQIRESYEMGADAILLIVASLSASQITEFKDIAEGFGLTCLVEVHTEEELETALNCQCNLIGINNRNLKTFKTDIQLSLDLKERIPDSVVCVSESGIHTTEHCQTLEKGGFDAILVGEALMRQSDPGESIHSLLGR